MFRLTRKLNIIQLSNVFRSFSKKVTKVNKSKCLKQSQQSYGQPTSFTHPYLMAKDDITPFIKKREYQDRRHKLVEAVKKHVKQNYPDVKRHLIVVPSASKQYMSSEIPYFFRQNTEFLYLTGCQEPDSCLVITITDSQKECITLFLNEKDERSELWNGPSTGTDNAPDFFGVDQSFHMGELESYVQSYQKTQKKSSLWYDFTIPVHQKVHKIMDDCLCRMGPNKFWESPKNFIQKQRLIKSPAEIILMQKSCEIASDAIVKTIQASRTGMNEHEIFAKVDYECRINGAEFLAYPPVVAGGNRATIIHYINNNQIVNDNEMVLMDAGCELHGYSSDITRTWPINGKFTKQQNELYEIVLNVQSDLINLLANFPSLDNLFYSMCTLLGKKLQEIGLISKNADNKELMKAGYKFCPHHVSHYLGMDVHDTPLITRDIKVQPGMIVTVEPGIYINEKNKEIPEEYRGLGIRIEDDILITDNGPVVLTQKCPKTLQDMEMLAKQNQ